MSSTPNTPRTSRPSVVRLALIAGAIVTAFFGAYAYASSRSGGTELTLTPAQTSAQASTSGGAGGSGCACCGSSAPTENGITGDEAAAAATVEGDVQRISVDLSKGYYDPNVIELKAGVPAEITFGQSSGCTGQVLSEELGFYEDLSTGAKTVKLPALEPGEYAFSCGMQMVYGKIVVK